MAARLLYGFRISVLFALGGVRENFVILRDVLYGYADLRLMLGRAPLVGAESAESRKAITPATASGDVHLERSAPGIARRLASVSIVPGRTALTRTACAASNWIR